MKIESIKIENFRGISEISIEFSSNVNVFVGVNGCGKSTILDAISISLSWLAEGIKQKLSFGKSITYSDIRLGFDYASITLNVENDNEIYSWIINQTRKGIQNPQEHELMSLHRVIELIQGNLLKESSVPLIAYYPSNRSSEKITLDTQNANEREDIFLANENSLENKITFKSFFQWYRNQDDILNENANYKKKWMIENRDWLSADINDIAYLLQSYYPNHVNGLESYTRQIARLLNYQYELNEPRFLLLELKDLLQYCLPAFGSSDYTRFFFLISTLIDWMRQMSDESEVNYFKDITNFIFNILEVLPSKLSDIYTFLDNSAESKKIIDKLCFKIIKLTSYLCLPYLSKNGRLEIEKSYNQIFPNNTFPTGDIPLFEQKTSQLKGLVQPIILGEINKSELKNRKYYRSIDKVNQAITSMLPEYRNLRISRFPVPKLLVDKSSITLEINQLSDGEKNLIALVGDIARRLCIANPESDSPLNCGGFILIDEIDLHLHPKWQRIVIPKLIETFPNCQFFLSTHSPHIINHVKRDSLFLLTNVSNNIQISKYEESYGMSIDRVMELIMDEDIRPTQVINELQEVYNLIERKDLNHAKDKLELIKKELDEDDPEILRLELALRKIELRK